MTDSSSVVLAEAALAAATSGHGKKKPKPQMGPVRQNLEAFGVAILAAVLLKWFCIEAFQIPTSSMQPTLMGGAGVSDRILVDKLLPLIREPKRWDITVFKYPLQKNQNYVKRLVGMPNDRLTIAGGNVYQVVDEGGKRTYRCERKPDDLQELMWKDVYPGRRLARAETKALGTFWGASPQSVFAEDGDAIVATLDGARNQLQFRDQTDGGLIDRVWDGYPEEVARTMRDEAIKTIGMNGQPQEIVPDVRIAATLTPEQAVDEFAMEIAVYRKDLPTWTYALMVRGGKARLVVLDKSNKPLGESPEFAFDLPAGAATEVAFAHVDDELIAWRDGDEVQRFDSSAWACRDGCVLPFDLSPTKGLSLPDSTKVVPQIVCKGKGKVRIADLRIDRDQHYTQSGAPDLIVVPNGHYYMLGDNTLQSVDSRGWTAIKIGVDANDNVVPPDTGVRNVRGNKRPMPLANKPDRDETPIPIPAERALVMIDEYGEILRLNADVSPTWPRVSFRGGNGELGAGEWTAPEETNTDGTSFVPRGDIQGRALLVFYPSRPLAWLFLNPWPGRFGFVR